MKKIALVFLFVFILCGFAYAQTGTLSAPVQLSVPTATKIQIRHVDISPLSKTMTVTYRWLTASDQFIYRETYNMLDHTWTCQDIPAQLPADCTAVGLPYKCCTGPGTGTECFAGETGFAETFGFVIRTQDVGVKLGVGLRNLIVAKMRASIPALSGITITFAAE